MRKSSAEIEKKRDNGKRVQPFCYGRKDKRREENGPTSCWEKSGLIKKGEENAREMSGKS